MKKAEPKITVLMPAYNAVRYIGKAIDSVLEQTFTAFELLIINDGSTDGTEEVIRSFNDERIRLINQSNQGIAAALNMGLMNANASLVARFDADDICLPHRLQVQYDFMLAHPDHIIVGSDAEYIDMNDEYVFTGRLPAHTNMEIQALALSKCPFIHSGVVYRKEQVLQEGGYDTHAIAFEDHLLWTKLIRRGKACNLPQILLRVRLNPESVSIDGRWRTKRFLEIKSGAIHRGNICAEEGNELKEILREQDNRKIKEGAYYSLLGKKYLWNNHQPAKARYNLGKAIRIHPGRFDSYAIMALSFFPKGIIDWVYKKGSLKFNP